MKLTKTKLKQIIKEELDNNATDEIPNHPGIGGDAKSLSQALLGYYGDRGLKRAFSKDDFGAGVGDPETKNIAIKMHNFILSVIPERYNFDKRIKDFRDELKKQSAKNKYAAQAVIDLDAVIEAHNRKNKPVNLKESDMKLARSQLKQIIKEEVENILQETKEEAVQGVIDDYSRRSAKPEIIKQALEIAANALKNNKPVVDAIMSQMSTVEFDINDENLINKALGKMKDLGLGR